MQTILVKAPAKVNLSLDIVGVRQDGYHLLEMVMQSVSLYDTVRLQPQGEGIALFCDDPSVPCDERNIAYRAAQQFFWYIGATKRGIQIGIEKHIPAQAGLAGGSADGAAVLVGLNRLFGEPVSIDALCSIGVQIGADLPFCIRGGTAFVEGIGEKITPLRPLTGCHILIVKPPSGIETAASFQLYDAIGTQSRPKTAQLRQAIAVQDILLAAQSMGNVLQTMHPIQPVEEIVSQLLDLKADGAVMTGSGSAVIGLYRDEPAASRAFQVLQQRYAQCYLTQPIQQGAICVEQSD